MDAKINCAVVVSDTHCGSLLGLLPPGGVRLSDGGVTKGAPVKPTPFQAWLWRRWMEFWATFVPEATEGEPFIVVHNGDAIEGRHHSQDVLVTSNLALQCQIANAVLRAGIEPVKRKVAGLIVVAGTEAHCGLTNETTEHLAAGLPVMPDSNGNRVRPELWLRLGKGDRHRALVHVLHHIGTTGTAAYETTAVHKEMCEAFQEAARWRDQPPDVIVRSHRHRAAETRIQTGNGYCTAVVTAGWQGKTPLCYRVAGARQARPQFGGLVIRSGLHDTYTRSAVWSFARSRAE